MWAPISGHLCLPVLSELAAAAAAAGCLMEVLALVVGRHSLGADDPIEQGTLVEV